MFKGVTHTREIVRAILIDENNNVCLEKLKDDEYIINHKVIDSKIIDKGIEMKLFFSVCENIGKEEIITDMKEVE